MFNLLIGKKMDNIQFTHDLRMMNKPVDLAQTEEW